MCNAHLCFNAVQPILASYSPKFFLLFCSFENFIYASCFFPPTLLICPKSQLGFYCCYRTPWLKASWGGKGWFHLYSLQLVVHHPWNLGQDLKGTLEAVTAAETDHGGVLSNGLLPMTSSACFLIVSGLPAQRRHCTQWVGLFHINYQTGKCPTHLTTGCYYWRHFLKVPFSKVTPAYTKLT